MKKSIIAILLLLNITGSYAKDRITIVHDTIHEVNNTKELEMYKMLYQNAKDNSSANYTILYTIIAIVVGFIVFILGSQIFLNFRLNRQDLENLKSTIKLDLSVEFAKLNEEFQNRDLKFAKEIADNKSQLNDTFNTITDSLHSRINIINSSLQEIVAKAYKSDGSLEAALIAQVSACSASLEANLNLSLKRNLKQLNELLISVTEISDYSSERIQELLKRVTKKYPEEFNVVINEIENEVAKKTITKLE
jgi:membrane-associated HD superfamily phosphohydrolase